MELVVPPVDNSEVIDDISLIKQRQQEAGRKRTVSKSKSTTSSTNTISRSMTLWPEFKIPIPDPDLGFTGEIFCGKGSLTPEQTLVEFISTSASYHSVKKQPLRALEWDLLKVFPFNVMPANAAAWYMAKRKFYMNQPLDQQLLPFLLKKYPEKFRVIGGSVIFLEVYKKDVAKAKLKYLVQYGLNAYFSHKADEYGVYFFDPFYYENTEPFHESLKQCSNGAKKLVQNYFSSPGIKDQFKFRHHSAYLVSISKQPDIKIVTNKTGVIISMINNQYGFIKFGDSGETALFCCKSLFKEGWQFSGDPLKLPAMKFDGYQIPGGGMKGEQAYSWYAVLVWCGRRPSPKYCSTAEDLNSTPVFREGRLQRMSVSGDGKRLRQPSSSMMVGQVMEIRRNGAILKVREDSSDKVFVPGWQRQITTCDGKWLSTLSGECIGLGDLVAYYVDTQDIKPGYTAVGKNVMVLKECQEVIEKPKRRRRRQSTERSAGARYEVGETTDADDEKPKRRNRKRGGRKSVSEPEDSETDEDVTDGELEWLEKDVLSLIDKEDEAKTLNLLKKVHGLVRSTRGSQSKTLKKSGIKNLRGGYTPMKNNSDTFWRMKRLWAKIDAGYNSESDPDYEPGDDVEMVTRPRTGSESQANTSFNGSTSAGSILSRRSRKSSMASVSTTANNTSSTSTQNLLPYWVREVSKVEKYDPSLEKFVADDKNYKEENDPDFELPATDDEIETESEDEENEEMVNLLNKEAQEDLTEDVKEGKHKEEVKKVVSPVKVTLTPSKDGEQEPVEQILTLESEPETEAESDGSKKSSTKQPLLWEKALVLTEQPEEYDSEEDPEYVPPAVIVDTDLEYDELLEGENYEVSDNEVEQLQEDAKKDAASLTPKCYMPIWIPIESPAEKIQRAKEQFAAASLAIAQAEQDTSGKDTDSNGKKDDPVVNKAVTGLVLETGLTPSMKKLSVGSKTEGEQPQPKRERKKSSKSSPKAKKSSAKSEDEKTGVEVKKTEEKITQNADPETPTNETIEKGDEQSTKESTEKVSEPPKVKADGEDAA